MSRRSTVRTRGAITIGVLVIAVVALATPATVAVAEPTTSCRSIPVDADPALRSDLARLDYGVDGSGVKIAVISDSFENPQVQRQSAAQDVAAGLLPGVGNPCGYALPVRVLAERTDALAQDEGRAMLQLVHGVAPGAELMFHAVDDEDPVDIAAAVDALAAAGADIIVDDVATGKEPFFQRSIVGSAIERATARGAVYLSAGGNDARIATAPRPGQEPTEISGWDTAAFRPAACAADVAQNAAQFGFTGNLDCMDFDQSAEVDTSLDYVVSPGSDTLVSFQWAEPAGAPRANFVPVATLDEALLPVVRLPDGVPGYQVRIPQRGSTGVLAFAVVRVSDPADQATLITPALALRTPGSMLVSAEYWLSDGDDVVGRSMLGHNGDPATISVAAAAAADPLVPRRFTSSGPTVYLFTPQGPRAEPFAQPQVNRRPDVMSVDGVRNSVLGAPTATPDVYVFAGTSAAAPNAAAVVALAMEADPTITQERARELLLSTARAVTVDRPGVLPEEVVGAGLIDAHAVLARVVAERPTPAPAQPALAATGAEPAPVGLGALALLVLGAFVCCLRGGRRTAR